MLILPRAAGRHVRPVARSVVPSPRLALALLLALAALLALARPAGAAGTGGIEVTPIPAVVNGRQVTAFHEDVPARGSNLVSYTLRNLTDATAGATIYGARAVQGAGGGYSIGQAGSSPYLRLPQQQVQLGPREVRTQTFRVVPGPDGRPGQQVYAAVVVEVRRGSVVQRAATLVYLQPGSSVPLPLLLVILAIVLIVAAGIVVLVILRRRRRLAAAALDA